MSATLSKGGRWRPVSTHEPCPGCEHSDWCAWSPDGELLRCMRDGTPPAGMRLVKHDGNGGTLLAFERATVGPIPRRNGSPVNNRKRPSAPSKPSAPPAKQADLAAAQERFVAALTPEQRDQLAELLGVSLAALDALQAGWATADDLRGLGASGAGWQGDYPAGAFSFPERDGRGQLVGWSFRTAEGRKGAPAKAAGTSRGLIVPATWASKAKAAPVLIVEGASDVAACEVLGLAAIGRPSNASGADDLARMLRGRELLIVGENDPKPSGAWPGRDGAERIASQIATTWRKGVAWALPPAAAKDVREWLARREAAGLSLDDAAACEAAGAELVAELQGAAEAAAPEKAPSTSEQLVRMAYERYRFGQSESGEPFAIELEGPNLAIMLRGGSNALRARLARDFRQRSGRVANQAALADALAVIEGDALDAPAELLALRVAEHEGGIVLDLGDTTGAAIVIDASGWRVVERSPVIFRRTGLTAELPRPEPGGNLEELRQSLNVTPETWPLVRGWLLAALIPSIPHPIMLLGGQQGTGKSTAARLLLGLVDPSSAPLRSEPRDSENWALAAAGSWAFAVDNVSRISPWWSEALCRAVTGDGWIRRRLYTDGDLAVSSFRRVMILTSIDPGALRGDLADRLLVADLEPITGAARKMEAEVEKAARELRPRVLGALLDLLAAVLAKLPDVRPPRLPRMADFGRVLAALDELDCSDGQTLALYTGQAERLASDVIEGDSVGLAIVELVGQSEWLGTAADLLDAITPASDRLPAAWPKHARGLRGQLNRLAPALGALGYAIEHRRESTTARTRLVSIRFIGSTLPNDPVDTY